MPKLASLPKLSWDLDLPYRHVGCGNLIAFDLRPPRSGNTGLEVRSLRCRSCGPLTLRDVTEGNIYSAPEARSEAPEASNG